MKEMIHKLLASIKGFLTETFHLSLAAILLSGLFYIRLLPRVSRELWENMNSYQIFSTCLSMGFIIFNIYLLLKVLEIIPENENQKSKYNIVVILTKISEYLTWVLLNFYGFLWYILENVANKGFHCANLPYRILNRLAKIILRGNKTFIFWLLISIKVLPSLIFVLAFTYDVLFCKQLNYTFKCIPWLLVPLLEKFIKFLFEDLYENYYEEMRDSMYETETQIPGLVAYRITPEFAEHLPDFVEDSEDLYDNYYVVLDDIKKFFVHYETWKYNVFPHAYVYLSIYSLRLAVLFYVLIYGVM